MKQIIILVTLLSAPLFTLGQQRIIFGEKSRNSIFSMDTDGSDLQLVIGKMLPRDLHYDSRNDKLIFTDQNNGDIRRCNPDGSELEILLDNLDEPRGLTLAPDNANMFWSEGSEIYRSGLQGQSPSLFFTHSAEIIDLTIDQINKTIYFISENNIISLVNSTGETNVVSSDINSGREIVVDAEAGTLFYMQNTRLGSTSGLYTMTTSGSGLKKIETDPFFLEGLAIDTENDLLFYSTWTFNNLYSISYDGTDENKIFGSFVSIPAPTEIAVDPASNTIFHVDLQYRDLLFSASYTGSGKKTLISDNVNQPEALAYDRPNDRLYYANGSTGFANDRTESIFQTNIDGENPELVFDQSDADSPRDMEIDLQNGHLYFANSSTIKRSDLDGSNVIDLYSDGNSKTGLALNIENSTIYWGDASDKAIKRGSFDGSSTPEIIVSDNVSLMNDIEINKKDGKIYWVDSFQNSVSRANLDGSNPEELIESVKAKGIYIDDEAERMYVTSDQLVFSADLDGSNLTELNVDQTRFAGPIILTEKTISSVQDDLTSGIQVYPNPVSEILTINLELDNAAYKMFNLNGQLLDTRILQTGANNIDIKNLIPGSYFVQLTYKNGKNYTSKIIKQK